MLPQFQSEDKDFTLMQNAWARILNPIVDNSLSFSLVLTNVALKTGSNTINHTLARRLTGWVLVRQRGAASVYDTQDSNNIPDKTLVLVSSANISVDLLVF